MNEKPLYVYSDGNTIEVDDVNIYSTHIDVDIDVHCFCGESIGFYDPECQKRCPSCGRVWIVTVNAYPAKMNDPK